MDLMDYMMKFMTIFNIHATNVPNIHVTQPLQLKLNITYVMIQYVYINV